MAAPASRLRLALAALALCVASAPAICAGTARPLLQTTLVAGLAHHEAREVWDQLRPGEPLSLEREPANPEDGNAVRVLWRGHLLGYLPRADNADVARLMDRGQPLAARIRAVARYRNHRRKLEVDVLAGW